MRPLVIIGCMALAGCVSPVTNLQNPTLTEQLIKSGAGGAAVSKDRIVCRDGATEHCVARGAKVFISPIGPKSTDLDMVAAELRQKLEPEFLIQDDEKDADVVVELLVAADGIDDSTFTVGIPSMTIPAVPGQTSTSTVTPAISVYSRNIRKGGVRLVATALNARTHAFITAEQLAGTTRVRSGTILTAFSWGRVELEPGVIADRGR